MTCPRCSVGQPCRGTEIPRLHELIEINPSYLSRLDPESAKSTSDCGGSLSENTALLARMKSCPSFEPRTDCGCGVNFCKRDDKEVSRQECFSCLRG